MSREELYHARYAMLMPKSEFLSLKEAEVAALEVVLDGVGGQAKKLSFDFPGSTTVLSTLGAGLEPSPLIWLALYTPLRYSVLAAVSEDWAWRLTGWDHSRLDLLHCHHMAGTPEELQLDQRTSALCALLGNPHVGFLFLRSLLDSVEAEWRTVHGRANPGESFADEIYGEAWDKWDPKRFSTVALITLEIFFLSRGRVELAEACAAEASARTPGR